MDKNVEIISNGIKEEFLDCFLVKPLDPIKVKKEFSKPIPIDKNQTVNTNTTTTDIVDYQEVEKEVKEVDSDFSKGVVLKLPISYQIQKKDTNNKVADINVGDTLIFRTRTSSYYDLFKDSILVHYYNIVAIEKC